MKIIDLKLAKKFYKNSTITVFVQDPKKVSVPQNKIISINDVRMLKRISKPCKTVVNITGCYYEVFTADNKKYYTVLPALTNKQYKRALADAETRNINTAKKQAIQKVATTINKAAVDKLIINSTAYKLK